VTDRQKPSLAGWSALVTGGGSGIGLGSARRLAADGASVTLCGRSAERLATAADAVRAVAAPGADVQTVPTDVTDENQVRAAVAAAIGFGPGPAEGADDGHDGTRDGHGRLDAVVVSAGGSETIGPLTQTDAEAWRRTLDLNVTGAMLTIKAAAPVMAAQGGGAIVAISSIASAVTHRWFGAYGPSKAALDHLCRVAADELGASGIRVNTVRPGLTRTDLVEAITTPGPTLDDYVSQTPLGRIGDVDDVTAAVRFLIGPEAGWITGQCLGVDGGHALRRGPDLSALLEPVFGAEGLRGVTPGR
jgi:NAD(P)-dependent dehydrogenase (short-subunit alcohol dehydrogenase family)